MAGEGVFFSLLTKRKVRTLVSDDTQRKRSNSENLGAKHGDGDRANPGRGISNRIALELKICSR